MAPVNPPRYPEAMRFKPASALIVAGACAVVMLCVGVAAFHWPTVHTHDSAILAGFVVLSWHSAINDVANVVVNLVSPGPYAVILLAYIVYMLRRRELALLYIVPAAMLGASASTEIVKQIFAHYRAFEWVGPGHRIGAASWPSGHATAAMMVALAAILIAPAARRYRVAPFACAFALAVAFSLLILAWHFPSDVVGGFLMAALWTAFALAALAYAQQRWPASVAAPVGTLDRRALYGPAAVVVLLALCAIALVIVPAHLTVSYSNADAWRFVGAIVIVLLGALITASVAVVTGHPAEQTAASDAPGVAAQPETAPA
jgi:membrane-associated phospholipid phosphatase